MAVALLVLANSESINFVAGAFMCKYGISTAMAGWSAGLFGSTLIGTACTVFGIKLIADGAAMLSRSILQSFKPTSAEVARPVVRA